jgi:hypothetical protein
MLRAASDAKLRAVLCLSEAFISQHSTIKPDFIGVSATFSVPWWP